MRKKYSGFNTYVVGSPKKQTRYSSEDGSIIEEVTILPKPKLTLGAPLRNSSRATTTNEIQAKQRYEEKALPPIFEQEDAWLFCIFTMDPEKTETTETLGEI